MTGKVINLRRERKNRNRTEKQTRAEANRQKFGRSKAQRQLDTAVSEKTTSFLDGHKLDD